MNKWKIAAGLLAAVWIYDTRIAFRNRRLYNALKEKHIELIDDFETILRERNEAAGLSSLYAEKLNEHGVPMDDFTRVIMNGLKDR